MLIVLFGIKIGKLALDCDYKVSKAAADLFE